MDYYYENTTMGEYMYVCTLTPYRKTMKTFLPLSLYLRYCWDCYVTSQEQVVHNTIQRYAPALHLRFMHCQMYSDCGSELSQAILN